MILQVKEEARSTVQVVARVIEEPCVLDSHRLKLHIEYQNQQTGLLASGGARLPAVCQSYFGRTTVW